MKKIILTGVILSLGITLSIANQSGDHQQPYRDQQDRAIKSLSEQDIDDLLNGRGWGFAKPAELNGLPGPIHLLEMQQDISLTVDQVKKITTLYQIMQAQAKKLGEEYIRLETELEQVILDPYVSEQALQQKVFEVEKIRGRLRYVHLSAHLKTPEILSKSQVEKYNQLRGYSSADPCGQAPAGHDSAMWKKHNNCSE